MRTGLLLFGALAACSHASPFHGSGLLTLVAEVPLPGASSRFDYQEVDAATGRLVVAHMNDNSVLILDLRDGSVLKVVPNISTPRGVAIADDAGLIFASAMPNQLVSIDATTLAEKDRVTVGNGPDGVAWDPADRIVASSDQRDGAISLVADAGAGARTAIPLGSETGNVIWDGARGNFWITVVRSSGPDQLIAIDPKSKKSVAAIDLPGCSGAHGLRLHPDGQSAFVACESNNVLARVDLGGTHAIATAPSGADPDVLSIDASLGWLYLAAESGDLTVFDVNQPGVALVGHESPGAASHTVAADPATHRVFFPLPSGASGSPALRILKPVGR
jgi:DNA-binding beta-propeller fold protein YncE